MRAYKQTRNDRAKIHYQLYRDNGYSVEEARKLRYTGYVDVTGLKVSKTTGNVVKSKNYKTVKRSLSTDNTVNKLRKVENKTTFTQHGMLLNSPQYKGEYNQVVQNVKRRDQLTDDQAYYFVWFMMDSGYSYEYTRKELLSSREFEQYDKIKKAKIEYGRITRNSKRTRKPRPVKSVVERKKLLMSRGLSDNEATLKILSGEDE